jgi:uncharacterized membrane protein (DUF373 family)
MAQEHQVEVTRRILVPGLSLVEDVVYVGLGILLSVAALGLLATVLISVGKSLWNHALTGQVVGLLDQTLLVLLIVELLYTVQVSFREHGLLAEPFLVVALIAVIRRILALTAEIPRLPDAEETVFHHYMYQLAILGVMVPVLVGSFVILRRMKKAKSQE